MTQQVHHILSRKYLKQNGVSWPQIFISEPTQARWRNSLVQFYGVDQIPQAFVVDTEGTIAAANVRSASNVENTLATLLASGRKRAP